MGRLAHKAAETRRFGHREMHASVRAACGTHVLCAVATSSVVREGELLGAPGQPRCPRCYPERARGRRSGSEGKA